MLTRDKDSQNSVAAATSPWPNILQLPSRSHDTSSDKAYQALKRWISDCLHDHSICSNRTVSNLPKRVLEIWNGQVYLRDSLGVQAKYACLSHCWGEKGAALQLNSATRETLKKGFLVQHLPKTFADAADTSSKLGIRYLWIDSICMYI
jgi:hypothetical protein